MTLVAEFVCVVCGRVSKPPTSAGTCPFCNDAFAILDVRYDMDAVASSMTRESLAGRALNHWRYRELLPVEPDDTAFAWPVGFTPILETPRLAEWCGVSRLRVKDDSRNPTASFKDRASSVGVLHALQQGARHHRLRVNRKRRLEPGGVRGDGGASGDDLRPAARAGPEVAQLLLFGADVRRVRGSYAQAYDLCIAECHRHDWYNRNCAINPYLVEGKKTCGLEIAEQTADRLPDWVVVSVGDGCTIAGIAKGLRQMHQLGFIDRVPRVLGVQASGMDPVAQAFETGALPPDFHGATVADSIDVPVPRNWRKAVAAVHDADGAFVRVTDERIMDAMKSAGRFAGVFAEPAAAASVAGIRQAVDEGIFDSRTDALAVITGSGLKDIASAMRIAGQPTEVDPLGS